MNISSDIRFILESALWAPSGENCQPWRFRVPTENSIEIFLDPGKDRSLYNWGQRASYVAIGAAIENALLAAGKKGYKTVVSLFPEGEQSLLVARVFFEKKENVKQDPLADAIQKRETSRKPYAIKPLSREEESALTSAAHDIPEITFSLTQKRDEVKTLGTVGSTNEVVMLANEFLHNFFFSHVNWTKQDDDRKKVGFFIDTLELPPPARIGFKILSSWKWAKILNKIGFNKFVGFQNALTNAKASGIGVIATQGNSPPDAVSAGRALERVWLAATAHGLSLQPLTGILYFSLGIRAGEISHFSSSEITHIESAYAEVERIFHLSGETPFFMFRVGRGQPPTARASRFTLEEVLDP